MAIGNPIVLPTPLRPDKGARTKTRYPNPHYSHNRAKRLAKRVSYLSHQLLYITVQEYWTVHHAGDDPLPVRNRLERDICLLLDNDLIIYWRRGLEEAILDCFEVIKDQPIVLEKRLELLEITDIFFRTFREWIYWRLDLAIRARLDKATLPVPILKYVRHCINVIGRSAFLLSTMELRNWYRGTP